MPSLCPDFSSNTFERGTPKCSISTVTASGAELTFLDTDDKERGFAEVDQAFFDAYVVRYGLKVLSADPMPASRHTRI